MIGRCSLLLLLFACSTLAAQSNDEEMKYAIVIHGGAGGDPSGWSVEYRQQRRDGLQAALERGVEMLARGDSAVDVVEHVVRIMEDDPAFNAGRGCVLNEAGNHELDASIMDGSNLQCGAVGSVSRIKNPISLARKVMTDTRHVLLIGEGADQFGEGSGLEIADASYFQTDRQRKNWEDWKQRHTDVSALQPEENYFGTVGCVARDQRGDLAAATSTGGLMGKRWGRVGDSPIIGAGNYADNRTCAVSGTGIGEEFIRHHLAADIAAQMRYAGADLQTAADRAIARLPADGGGVIAVDQAGNTVVQFNTVGMSHAYADSQGQQVIKLSRQE
jgi:L-asparaginase / beta-aspartyl-peptidase